jgi:hypothetical protein
MTATAPCRRCRRPIREDSPYWTRRVGPKCGGRIRKTRRPATAKSTPAPLPGAALEPSPDQLALDFEAVTQ